MINPLLANLCGVITQLLFNMDEIKKPDNENNPDENLNTPQPPPKYDYPFSPVAAGFIGLFGGFFLYQILGGLLTLLIFGFDIDSAPINGIRLMTMAGQILFLLLPALILSKIFYKNVESTLRLNIPNWKEILLFVIGIVVLTPLLQNFLYIQNYLIEEWAEVSGLIKSLKSMFDELNELVEKTYFNLLKANNFFEAALIILVIAISPAFCEEILFRGFIQKSFEMKLKPFWGAIITAVFFGIFHLNPYGLIPLIVLGFYFGFAAYTSNSIFIPIILHFLNNFSAVLIFFIFGDDELLKSSPSSEIDLNTSIISFLALLVLFSGIIILIRRYYLKLKT
jgi:membrane protease YdiL (CAAX protease family)